MTTPFEVTLVTENILPTEGILTALLLPQEEAAAVCQYQLEEERLRQVKQHYLKLLRLEAILKTGSHTSCPVLPVLPHPVGVAGYIAKRRLHLLIYSHPSRHHLFSIPYATVFTHHSITTHSFS